MKAPDKGQGVRPELASQGLKELEAKFGMTKFGYSFQRSLHKKIIFASIQRALLGLRQNPHQLPD